MADAVLTASRTKADRVSARRKGAEATRAVAVERARADRVLSRTRASADGALRGVRLHEAAALVELLVQERAATDADLLTERARSDAALAHRDDFLGIVAHDVRNLLNGVVLNLEVMRTAGEGSGPRPASPHRIRRAVARMTRLIGDLVDITSINAGELPWTEPRWTPGRCWPKPSRPSCPPRRRRAPPFPSRYPASVPTPRSTAGESSRCSPTSSRTP